MYVVHEGEQPFFGRARLLQSFPKRPKLLQPPLYDGFAELFLGLEVVVDVAQRDSSRLGDIGEACFSEPQFIGQLDCRLD
jgi:hypothetical protein